MIVVLICYRQICFTDEPLPKLPDNYEVIYNATTEMWEEHQIEEHQDTAALSTQLQLPATASKMYTSEYSSAAVGDDAVDVHAEVGPGLVCMVVLSIALGEY